MNKSGRPCKICKERVWYNGKKDEVICERCQDKIKEPKIKVGDDVKDFNGHEYKVLVVSNEYQEIKIYDSNCHYLDIVSDEQLEEDGINSEDRLYCAVENEYGKPFVFPITRDSKILGE